MNEEAIQAFKPQLIGLNYTDILPIDPDFWIESRLPTEPFPEYTVPKIDDFYLSLYRVHFMQNSIHSHFHNHHFNIISDANAIKQGHLSIKTLPKIEIWQDKDNKIEVTHYTNRDEYA